VFSVLASIESRGLYRAGDVVQLGDARTFRRSLNLQQGSGCVAGYRRPRAKSPELMP
jgi:hypothetical protein